MKHYVYYLADGSIGEISPIKSAASESFIEVESEAVEAFFTGTENAASWYVKGNTLKKRSVLRTGWHEKTLIAFCAPSDGAGLRVIYLAGMLRFAVVGEVDQQEIKSFTILVTKGRDPHFVITSFEVDYAALFAQPIIVAVGRLPADFWLYSVQKIFNTMTLDKQ